MLSYTIQCKPYSYGLHIVANHDSIKSLLSLNDKTYAVPPFCQFRKEITFVLKDLS